MSRAPTGYREVVLTSLPESSDVFSEVANDFRIFIILQVNRPLIENDRVTSVIWKVVSFLESQ